MDGNNVRLDVFFGHVKLDSRMRREGDRLIGEGRSMHYDMHGKLVKDSGWQPTGCVAYLNGYEPPRSFYVTDAAGDRAK